MLSVVLAPRVQVMTRCQWMALLTPKLGRLRSAPKQLLAPANCAALRCRTVLPEPSGTAQQSCPMLRPVRGADCISESGGVHPRDGGWVYDALGLHPSVRLCDKVSAMGPAKKLAKSTAGDSRVEAHLGGLQTVDRVLQQPRSPRLVASSGGDAGTNESRQRISPGDSLAFQQPGIALGGPQMKQGICGACCRRKSGAGPHIASDDAPKLYPHMQ